MTLSVTVRRRLALALAGFTAVSMTLVGGARANAVPAPCRTSQLMVWRAVPGSGAAGSVYHQLELSNVSRRSCSLSGFPGVAAVTGTGSVLGLPATRDRAVAPRRVPLAPGATAHVVLRVTDVGVYSGSACRPERAAGLAVRPPGRSRAAFVPFRLRVCARKGPHYLSVRAVQPGAGIPGYSQ